MCGLITVLALFASCEEATQETAQDTTLNTTQTGDDTLTPLIDSNTNWLMICSEDADCDEGVCSCGSCVLPCEESRGCMVRPGEEPTSSISCVEVDPVSEVDSCGEDYMRPMTRICLPQCEIEDDCPEELVCHEGMCKRPRRGERRPPRSGPPSPEMQEDACRMICVEELEQSPEMCRETCGVCEERCEILARGDEDLRVRCLEGSCGDLEDRR